MELEAKAKTVIVEFDGGVMYVGNGSFLPGIPARDLTKEEVEKFGVDVLFSSKLYVPSINTAPKKSKRLEAADADGGN